MCDYIIAIDPSQQRSAIAWCPAGVPQETEVYVAGAIEEIGNLEPLKELARKGANVFCMIECPTWSGPGTRETRAAAVAWERVIYRLFPKRSVKRVDPKEWQNMLLSNVPRSGGTKERSKWYANRVLNVDVGNDPDMADAACILHFARLRAGGRA